MDDIKLFMEHVVYAKDEIVLFQKMVQNMHFIGFTCYDAIHLLQGSRQHVTGIRHHLRSTELILEQAHK